MQSSLTKCSLAEVTQQLEICQNKLKSAIGFALSTSLSIPLGSIRLSAGLAFWYVACSSAAALPQLGNSSSAFWPSLITLTRLWVSLLSGNIMANPEPPKLLGYFREAALSR